MKQPLVSIIVPAYNEEKVIGRLLMSIRRQSYPYIETIVVDDKSTDDTVKISKKFTKNVFLREHFERSVQRNFGAKRSKGRYLLFLDADMKLSKKVIEECVKVMNLGDKNGAVTIPEISVASNFWESVKAHERNFYNLEGDTVTDAARFLKRSIFQKLGGYDEKLTGPEDWDLPERIRKAGYKIVRVNSVIYHYERIPSLWKLMKKKYYYGLGSYRYLKKQKISAFSPKTIYFLRPVFYKNWRNMIREPFLTFSMMIMLFCEFLSGGFGYLVGRWKAIKSSYST